MTTDFTILTKRDTDLVQAGYWPVDCEPARKLNEIEIAEKRRDYEERGRTWPDPLLFIPCVHRGTLMFQRRTELLGTISSVDVGSDIPGGGAT
jgi:hypothetical protein